MITILIVDDQAAVREGLRLRLGLEADMRVIGETDDGREALELARTLHPKVVIMDMELLRMDGLTVTRLLYEADLSGAVVILSLHDDQLSQSRAISAGATAFVSKQARDEALLSAIRHAAFSGAGPKPASVDDCS